MINGAMPRLGDLIDDFCPRCRHLLNHAVASMVGGQVAKVICQTCLSEHAYLHEDGTKRKKAAGGRETLFDQVLAHGAPSMESAPAAAKKKKASAPAHSKEKPRRSGK